MSKAKLKKTLAALSKEEMAEMVMELYERLETGGQRLRDHLFRAGQDPGPHGLHRLRLYLLAKDKKQNDSLHGCREMADGMPQLYGKRLPGEPV